MGFASRAFLSTASLEAYVYSILIRSSYVKKNLYGSFTSLILVISFFVTIFLDLLRIFIHTSRVQQAVLSQIFSESVVRPAEVGIKRLAHRIVRPV
jgi:hypothetical protein